MFGAQHLHQPIPSFCAVLLRLQHAPHISLSYPRHHHPHLPSEHRAVVCLSPVLLRLLPVFGGELLLTILQRLLHKHTVSPGFPGVNPLLNPPPDRVGCGDMSGSLQYHRLEDDEPLRVSLSVLHPTQLVVQGPGEATPDLPTQHVVAAGGNDREVMTPTLPQPVVRDALVMVITCVCVYPVPVDLLEL